MEERNGMLVGFIALVFAVVGWFGFILLSALFAHFMVVYPDKDLVLDFDATSYHLPAVVSLIVAVVMNGLALLLGIVGLFMKTQRRFLPVAAVVLGIGQFVVIGLLMVFPTLVPE